MASKEKSKKKIEKPKKGKAYLDTTGSKVVKSKEKMKKAVVESVQLASNKEEFLNQLSQLRDNLHDFAVDEGDRSQLTKALYEAITGKVIKPTFDEEGDEEEFLLGNWENFNKHWDEIEEAAKHISEEKMIEIIQEFKYDLDPNYYGESVTKKDFKDNMNIKAKDLMNALNEAIKENKVEASKVNEWLDSNKLEDVLSKVEKGSNKVEVSDIVNLVIENEIEFPELQKDTSFRDESMDIDEETEKEAINQEKNDNKESNSSEEESKESISESVKDEYDKFFMDKLKEFGVDSPKDLSKEQWEEIDTTWIGDNESNYQEYFKRKMDEFNVKSPKDLTDEQWEEINHGWKSEEEKANEKKSYADMKRLRHLMTLKESANELVDRFELKDIDKIKESLVEELTDKEYEIVLEDVYKKLNIEVKEVKEDFEEDVESLNESLRNDLHDKLL